MSDRELVQRCLNGNAEKDWSLFFTRFNCFIDQRICKTLMAARMGTDVETVASIRMGINKKIINREIFKEDFDPYKFRSWLGKVIANHTCDWIRGKLSQCRAMEHYVESTMVSLSDPLAGATDQTYEDIIVNESSWEGDQELDEEIDKCLGELQGLKDNYRLALLVSIMYYEPLSEEAIAEIASLRRLSVAEIGGEVEKIKMDLERKHDKLLHDQDRAAILWAVVMRLSRRLQNLERDPATPEEKITALQKEIAEKTKRMDDLRQTCRRPIRPSTKAMAALLGIPEKSADTVNVLLFRAREILTRRIFAERKSP